MPDMALHRGVVHLLCVAMHNRCPRSATPLLNWVAQTSWRNFLGSNVRSHWHTTDTLSLGSAQLGTPTTGAVEPSQGQYACHMGWSTAGMHDCRLFVSGNMSAANDHQDDVVANLNHGRGRRKFQSSSLPFCSLVDLPPLVLVYAPRHAVVHVTDT